jgi:hypothetical protein
LELIAMFQKTGSAESTDPDKIRKPPPWYRVYAPVKIPVTGVTFVFDSRSGPMPAGFKRELDEIAKALKKKYNKPVTYEFWPR